MSPCFKENWKKIGKKLGITMPYVPYPKFKSLPAIQNVYYLLIFIRAIYFNSIQNKLDGKFTFNNYYYFKTTIYLNIMKYSSTQNLCFLTIFEKPSKIILTLPLLGNYTKFEFLTSQQICLLITIYLFHKLLDLTFTTMQDVLNRSLASSYKQGITIIAFLKPIMVHRGIYLNIWSACFN